MDLINEPQRAQSTRSRSVSPWEKEDKKEGRLRGEDNAFDAVFEERDVKVDEEGEGVFGHFQVREDLCFVYWGGARFWTAFNSIISEFPTRKSNLPSPTGRPL